MPQRRLPAGPSPDRLQSDAGTGFLVAGLFVVGLALLSGCSNVFSDASRVVNNRRVVADPQLLKSSEVAGAIESPLLVPIAADKVMVVWLETPAALALEVYARTLDAEGNTGPIFRISNTAGAARRFEVSANGNGDVAVAMTETVNRSVSVAVYDADDRSWSAPVVVNPGLTDIVGYPSLAIDNAGRILTTWTQWVAGEFGTYTSFYRPGSGWTLPFETDGGSDDVNGSRSPDTVVASNGIFHIAWGQERLPDSFFYTRSFNPATDSWESEVEHEVQSGNSRRSHELLALKNGEVYAVWIGAAALPNVNLAGKRYSPGSGWGPVEILDSSTAVAAPGWIAADSRDGMLSVGYLRDVAGANKLFYVEDRGGGWSAPLQVNDDVTAITFEVDVAVDSQEGTLMARREGSGGFEKIVATRYSPGSGLGVSRIIDPTPTLDVPDYAPATATTPDGTVFVVYVVSEGGSEALYTSIMTVD